MQDRFHGNNRFGIRFIQKYDRGSNRVTLASPGFHLSQGLVAISKVGAYTDLVAIRELDAVQEETAGRTSLTHMCGRVKLRPRPRLDQIVTQSNWTRIALDNLDHRDNEVSHLIHKGLDCLRCIVSRSRVCLSNSVDMIK